jgi:hypothetical protein
MFKAAKNQPHRTYLGIHYPQLPLRLADSCFDAGFARYRYIHNIGRNEFKPCFKSRKSQATTLISEPRGDPYCPIVAQALPCHYPAIAPTLPCHYDSDTFLLIVAFLCPDLLRPFPFFHPPLETALTHSRALCRSPQIPHAHKLTMTLPFQYRYLPAHDSHVPSYPSSPLLFFPPSLKSARTTSHVLCHLTQIPGAHNLTIIPLLRYRYLPADCPVPLSYRSSTSAPLFSFFLKVCRLVRVSPAMHLDLNAFQNALTLL